MIERALRRIRRMLTQRRPLAPALFQVELTARCNLRCAMCALSSGLTRPTGAMDLALFRDIVDQSKRYGLPIGWFHHFGETLMYPHLRAALSYFREHGLGTGAVSTNAVLLDDERIDILLENTKYVLCCVDTMQPDAYREIRNNEHFERVRGNIKRLIEERERRQSPTTIAVQFLRTQFNQDEDIGEMMEYFGQHENLKYIEKGTVKHPRGRDVTVYDAVNGACDKRACDIVRSQLCVLWTGECVACCWDADGEQVIGNLRQQSLASIWQGRRHKQLQRHLAAGAFDRLPLCDKCAGPGSGDSARVAEQIAVYVEEWRATNARVVLAPADEAMLQLLRNSALRQANVVGLASLSPSASGSAPGGIPILGCEEIAALRPDIVFIHSPSLTADVYFKLRHLQAAGVRLTMLGGFLG